MRLLLDTHALIWHIEDSSQMRRNDVAAALTDGTSDICVSMASFWEMAIKLGLGKLRLPEPLRRLMDLCAEKGLMVLPISKNHILRVESLEPHHRDPFDRMLVAQALVDGLALVSNEEISDRYGVTRIW